MYIQINTENHANVSRCPPAHFFQYTLAGWVGDCILSKLFLFLKTGYFSSAFSFLKCILEAGARSHQVRAFPALEEDPSLLPSIYIGWLSTTFNSNSRGFNAVFWPLKATHMYKPTDRQKQIHKIKNGIFRAHSMDEI